ncbi:hypothetical protein BJ741DRAFT_710288 [Chytriomyces cf. hyalinus JEL632]|nr:hypothetical protein BJ741DRAFT_710288 [Chytriomyces cf. hyalinus JEL632]
MTVTDDIWWWISVGILWSPPVIFVVAVTRFHLEEQRRLRRQYLAFHGKLGALTAQMAALEERSCRMSDALFAAITDGTPPQARSDLRALLDDIYAQLAILKKDYLQYESQMNTGMAQMSSHSFDKLQKLLGQQPSHTQPFQVASLFSPTSLPSYSNVDSKSACLSYSPVQCPKQTQ